MANMIVTFTVQYECEYEPTDDDAKEAAMFALLDQAAPDDVEFDAETDDGSDVITASAVGWRVEHPDWGDLAIGTLKGTLPPAITQHDASADPPRITHHKGSRARLRPPVT